MTMRAFSLGDHIPALGGGVPITCAPIVAATRAEALRQAVVLAEAVPAPDIVELRADFLRELELEEFAKLLDDLHTVLGPSQPLLCTNRLAAEGGAGGWNPDDRLATLQIAIASGHVALVDLELATPLALRQEVLAVAHAQGVGVIISAHDFRSTPDDARLDGWLGELMAAGGDAAKLAVTATTADDALRLLQATQRAFQAAPIPLITLSMGPAGTITRLAGPFFGATLSYAVVGEPSAPGQLPLALVRSYWQAAGLRGR